MEELNGVVSQVIEVSPIMKVFRIAPIGWELPDFKAGQFVALFLPVSAPKIAQSTAEETETDPNKMIKRAYSIASSSKSKEFLEFYITLVHSGALTPRLFNLKIGDKVGVGQKFVGMFTLDQIPNDQNVVLIATGTGVAPYMSMLRSDALKRTGKLAVIHGAANSWDLGYSSELQLLQSFAPNFSYIPTITEPQKELAQWNGYTNWIQDMWKNGVVQEKWGVDVTPENTHVFLCGNPRMTGDMTKLLEEEGYSEWSKKNPEGQIHVEKFF
ncbi:MAG: ferredoxin--NADP reductase [Bacteroidales bacterium]|nr:ferredoxin--NADP reductase [Bacteroidales bacterium]